MVFEHQGGDDLKFGDHEVMGPGLAWQCSVTTLFLVGCELCIGEMILYRCSSYIAGRVCSWCVCSFRKATGGHGPWRHGLFSDARPLSHVRRWVRLYQVVVLLAARRTQAPLVCTSG